MTHLWFVEAHNGSKIVPHVQLYHHDSKIDKTCQICKNTSMISSWGIKGQDLVDQNLSRRGLKSNWKEKNRTSQGHDQNFIFQHGRKIQSGNALTLKPISLEKLLYMLYIIRSKHWRRRGELTTSIFQI